VELRNNIVVLILFHPRSRSATAGERLLGSSSLSNLRLIVYSLTQTMGYAPSYDTVIAGLLAISLVVVFIARAIRLRPGLGHALFAPFVQFISASYL
jgi:hypothetical protein